jgi:hypothetical protein
MPLDDVRRLIVRSKELGVTFSEVLLSGGEPLLWAHLAEGLKLLRESGIAERLVLVTNATRPELLAEVMPLLDHARLSNHGDNDSQVRAIHAAFADKVSVSCLTHRKPPDVPIYGATPVWCNCLNQHLLAGRMYVCPNASANCLRLGLDANAPEISCSLDDDFAAHFAANATARFSLPICSICLANTPVWECAVGDYPGKAMKIAAVCCTYLRPHYLGAAIDSFLRQTHQNRKLIILDDAGQYDPQQGDRWELVSVSERYPTLGAKRNAIAAMAFADPTVDAIAVMDDDDFYWPNWLQSIATALSQGPWCVATLIYVERPHGELTIRRTQWSNHYRFHGAWGFTRDGFARSGGYDPAKSHGEDIDLYLRAEAALGPPVDATPESEAKPYFLWDPRYPNLETQHLSRLDPATGYDSLRWDNPPKAELDIKPLRDFRKCPVNSEIAPK